MHAVVMFPIIHNLERKVSFCATFLDVFIPVFCKYNGRAKFDSSIDMEKEDTLYEFATINAQLVDSLIWFQKLEYKKVERFILFKQLAVNIHNISRFLQIHPLIKLLANILNRKTN